MYNYYCVLCVKLYKSKLKLDKFEELITIDFIKSELKPVSGSIFVFLPDCIQQSRSAAAVAPIHTIVMEWH